MLDRLTVLFLKFLEYFHKLQLFIWWLLEIHVIKIVSSYIILVSVTEVSTIMCSAFNAILLFVPLWTIFTNFKNEIEVLRICKPCTSREG